MDKQDKKDDKKPAAGPLPSGGAKPGPLSGIGAKPGSPSIPTLKDTLKPQVKIKGLQAGLSLVERLKAFKKKDLAFILAGLGVLFMAPLAEHFLMAPEGAESGAFKEGWGFREGANNFGKGGSPYEGGINGLAPGGLAGGGSDVITPLNVRDPSQLVMGPGASQQPPASASTPAAAPPPPTDSKPSGGDDWKDALKASASGAAHAAAKRAALPVPKVPLSNGGLRGLGAVSGGGGGSFNLAPISAANVPNRAAASNSLSNVKAAQGFKGASGARGSGTGGNFGALENLKRAAGLAGSDFNRSGPAASNLEQAANRDMSGGIPGGGGASETTSGASDKAASQSQSKDGKSTGESLEFLRLKMEQDKAIELKWKMIEQQQMMWPKLQEKMIETFLMKGLVEPIASIPGGLISGLGKAGSAGQGYYCCPKGEDPKASTRCSVKSGLPKCTDQTKDDQGKPCIASGGLYSEAGQSYECYGEGGKAGGGDAAKPKAGGGTNNAGGAAGSVPGAGIALGGPLCTQFKTISDEGNIVGGKRIDTVGATKAKNAALSLLVAGAAWARAMDILYADRAGDLSPCQTSSGRTGDPAADLHLAVRKDLREKLNYMANATDNVTPSAASNDVIGADTFASKETQKALATPSRTLLETINGYASNIDSYQAGIKTLYDQQDVIAKIKDNDPVKSALPRADNAYDKIILPGNNLDLLTQAKTLIGDGTASSGACPSAPGGVSGTNASALWGMAASCASTAQSLIQGISDSGDDAKIKSKMSELYGKFNSQMLDKLAAEVPKFVTANGKLRTVVTDAAAAKNSADGKVKVCYEATKKSINGASGDPEAALDVAGTPYITLTGAGAKVKKYLDALKNGGAVGDVTFTGIEKGEWFKKAVTAVPAKTEPCPSPAPPPPAECPWPAVEVKAVNTVPKESNAANSTEKGQIQTERTAIEKDIKAANDKLKLGLETEEKVFRNVHNALGAGSGPQKLASDELRRLNGIMREVDTSMPDSRAASGGSAPAPTGAPSGGPSGK